MSKITAELKKRIFYNEEIETVTPLDLTGTPEADRMEIWYLYSKYGRDPERRKLCEGKLEEARDAAGRYRI